jgi:hypothetical protein
MTGPAWLYDASDPLPQVFFEENTLLGIRRWTNKSRQARLLQRFFAGEKIDRLPAQERTWVYEERYTPADTWDTQQQAQAATRVKEIEAQQERYRQWSARLDAWLRLNALERQQTEKPKPWDEVWLTPYTPKDRPKILGGK